MNHSYLAYEDCREAFEKGLESENGVRIKFKNAAEAVRFRLRMNDFRIQTRELSKHIHPPDSPLWGTSPYDALILSIPIVGTKKGPDGEILMTVGGRPRQELAAYIEIKKRSLNNLEVEALQPPTPYNAKSVPSPTK